MTQQHFSVFLVNFPLERSNDVRKRMHELGIWWDAANRFVALRSRLPENPHKLWGFQEEAAALQKKAALEQVGATVELRPLGA